MEHLVGWFGIALVAAMLIAGGSAHAAPRLAEPATDDADAVLHPSNWLALDAQLADLLDLATVSTGSTAGFPADPRLDAVGDAAVLETPGATGWRIFFAPSGSTYTIDSCGSDFKHELTLYEVRNDEKLNHREGRVDRRVCRPGVRPVHALVGRLREATRPANRRRDRRRPATHHRPSLTAPLPLSAPGALAEWLRSGLQSRLHRFDSGRRLYETSAGP